MRRNVLAFLLFLFFGFSIHSKLLMDPTKLSYEYGGWHEKSGQHAERYLDFYYGERLVFRALERFLQAINLLIEQAKSQEKALLLKTNNVFSINSESKIKKVLQVNQARKESPKAKVTRVITVLSPVNKRFAKLREEEAEQGYDDFLLDLSASGDY